MLALSIRQPYAELILRGVKTIEYRSRPTRLIGQRFYIYAAKKWAGVDHDKVTGWQGDKVNRANGHPRKSVTPSPGHPFTPSSLPTGVIVGTAVITKCVQNNSGGGGGHPPTYEWHLSKVKRLPNPRGRKPKGRPQPVWFNPF